MFFNLFSAAAVIFLGFASLRHASVGHASEESQRTQLKAGQLVQVVVEPEAPQSNDLARVRVRSGSRMVELAPDARTGNWEGQIRIPRSALDPSRVGVQVELLDRAGNYSNLAPQISVQNVVQDLEAPRALSVNVVQKSAKFVEVRMEVAEANALAVEIQVSGELTHEIGGGRVSRVYAKASGMCTRTRPAHCWANVQLPAEIAGSPLMTIELRDEAGNQSTINSDYDFEFWWKSRRGTAREFAPVSISELQVTEQKGSEVAFSFRASGGDGYDFSSLLMTAPTRNTVLAQRALKAQVSCAAGGLCTGRLELPKASNTQDVVVSLGVYGKNGQSAWLDFESGLLDSRVMEIDTTAPGVKSIVVK